MKAIFCGISMNDQDDLTSKGEARFDPVKTPYEVEESSFPRLGSLEEQLHFLLRYVVLAPSTHNTQPWRFALSGEGIEIYGDYTRRMPVVDPGNRELLMSIGAAVFNLRVAAAHFGMPCRVEYNLSGDSERPLAFARLEAAVSRRVEDERLDSLFPLLKMRHTTRAPFLLTRIPSAVLERLAGVGERSRATLRISTDGSLNTAIADLVAEAEQAQLADPKFRQELAGWIRPEGSEHDDGITAAALGLTGSASKLAPYIARSLDLSKQQAAQDKNLCVEAPALAVILSEDAVPHWLDAGEMLEHLLLAVVREGLHFSYFNLPIHIPEFRVRIRGLLGSSTWPQLLLRIGYSLSVPPQTPRRPLEDVIISRASAACTESERR
jgi:nitroreductase